MVSLFPSTCIDQHAGVRRLVARQREQLAGIAGTWALTAVPPPGVLSIDTFPATRRTRRRIAARPNPVPSPRSQGRTPTPSSSTTSSE
jgi:hypothetical protein